MKPKVHAAIFLISVIGITIIITLVAMAFESMQPDFSGVTNELWITSILGALPWALILSIVFYPCLYCRAKMEE